MRMMAILMALATVTGCSGSAERSPEKQSGARLVSSHVSKAPTVDGKGDDAIWQSAAPLELVVRRVWPPDVTKVARVWLRTVHTGTHVYVLAVWEDETKDDESHKSWVWDAAKNAYVEGTDREDMFSLAFELSGVWNPDMLSGEEAVWDVWQWKATRTNPQGYAMDRTHRYTREKPQGKAKEYPTHRGSTIWIGRPEDAGDTVEKKQAAPKEKQEDRVSQYLPGTPTGSAADVRAKGTWADGKWTLEFERELDTGHADDTAFRCGRAYSMAVGTHDRTGDMDKASGTITLRLE